MKKKFNTAGRCFPKKHFMVDFSAKIDSIFPLIEEGEYFTINRPHQYGKTTLWMTNRDFLYNRFWR